MRVILDANVAIAAVAARGLCSSVLQVCLEQHDIVLCEGVLKEIRSKLEGKLNMPAPIVDEYIVLLREQGILFEPAWVPESICRDPDDRMVLGLVEPGQADVILTGDKDLLIIGAYMDARILSPREFHTLLSSGGV